MASITSNVTLTSSGLSSSAINISKAPTLTVNGDFKIEKVALSTTSKLILTAADYGASYVWLYNTDSSIAISIGEDAAEHTDAMDQVHMLLAAGEWAFFPWDSTVNLYADAASGTPKLEIAIFEKA